MKTVKTPKGTELPLVQLKGKDYLQVAHRLIWFNEVVSRYTINTEFLMINDEQTVCRSIIMVYDDKGALIRSSTATKRETKKDFSDHSEKAETGAIGRALALLGYGTQFAVADLDEGDRIVDAPVVNTKTAEKAEAPAAALATSSEKKKPSSFRSPPKADAPKAEVAAIQAPKELSWGT